jgi:hypothetical protein
VQQELHEKRSHIRYLSEINDEDLTFQPKISSNSYHLANNRKTRASSKGSSCSQNSRKCIQSNEDCTFTPYLTSFTYNNCKNPSKNDFLERQKFYQSRSQARHEAAVNKVEESGFRFTPEIDSTSKYLAEHSKYRTSEKLENRLTKEAVKNRELKENLQEKYYSGFTYEPEINSISKSIGKSSSLTEIANNKFSLALKQRLAEEKAVDEERKNSFTPKITKNKKFEYVSSSYKQSNEMLGTIKQQFYLIQQKREESRKLKEMEEMKNCTFKPQGNIGCIFTNEGRVEVKGMDRFLELKSIAKKKEEEMKNREKKMFFQSLKNRTDQSFTIPQPFNIHPSMKKEKVEKVKRELGEKERNECVFRPKLIE